MGHTHSLYLGTTHHRVGIG